MTIRALFVVLLITALFALAGCPRSEEGTDTGDTSSTDTSATDTEDGVIDHGDHTHAEGEDASHGEDMGDSGATGENPCNPCGDSTSTDNPCGNGTDNPCGDTADASTEEGVVEVVFETAKGNFTIAVHPDWAPLGAARFLELVKSGYYDGAPLFRNVEGFMVQFGIAADPADYASWANQRLQDDPVKKSNSPGMVTFAMAGPNTRTTQVFINKADNSFLDGQGFAPFGEVTEGMDVVMALYVTGDGTVNQGELMQRGIEYYKEVMPEGDVITKAYVKE